MTIERIRQKRFEIGGADYMKICFDFTAYWGGSAFDRAAGIVHFYQRSLGLIGDTLRFYETDTSEGALPVDDETRELLPFWLTGTKSRRSIYILFLESGAHADEPSDRAFLLRAWEATDPPVGCVRLILPVDYPEIAEGQLVRGFADLVRDLSYSSGHAGYAVNWNETGDNALYVEREMRALARRYPGIDLPDTTATLTAIPHGIKRVNWLTLLGKEQCERLGGVSALRQALGQEIIVHELPAGVIIQAGPRPEIGDMNRKQYLPLYHRVGVVLEPIRARPHPAFLAGGKRLADEELTEDWLGHFDHPPGKESK